MRWSRAMALVGLALGRPVGRAQALGGGLKLDNYRRGHTVSAPNAPAAVRGRAARNRQLDTKVGGG
jgi:hypothetical protein